MKKTERITNNERNIGKTQELFLRTEDLCVGYNGKALLKDINIGIYKGEILTLIGPNGAGKTTILRSIIRQLSILGGAVYIGKNDAAALDPNTFARELSVVLTDRIRSEMMTCYDVVATGRYPYTGKLGVLSDEDRAVISESMELVKVKELADCDFSRISDGQKQRVMLARALCQRPRVLVLDEPTSFLDVRYKIEFLSILQKLARSRGLTVVMSLHELDLAQRVSDRIACVKGDGIDRFGTPGEIFKGGYIKELYSMEEGSYDDASSQIELPAPVGRPEVFVLSGCGRGVEIFRKLQRENTPFIAGILWENDMDYPAARALAAKVISKKPFTPLTKKDIEEAKAAIDSCPRFISALNPKDLTGQAATLSELIEYANGK